MTQVKDTVAIRKKKKAYVIRRLKALLPESGAEPATATATEVDPVAQPPRITAEERRRRIAELAYFKAERRGFRNGSAEWDWLEAEAEIDAKIFRET